MSLTEEEMMDRAGSEKLPAAGGKVSGVKNMQRSLADIGMAVRLTGVIDQPTVDAINSIFNGWDGAPPKLRAGDLTPAEVRANLPTVEKYLRKAIGGRQQFGDATRDQG